MLDKFWKWYERYYVFNIGLASGLFLLQLVHLYWLTADVVAYQALGRSFFEVKGLGELLILVVDYTEIPALLTTSLVYVHSLRKGYNTKALLYLLFLNSQWLHIFWITDEFVIEELSGSSRQTLLPGWLAWIAIAIDYLELPVIYDTIRNFWHTLLNGNTKESQNQ